MHVLDTPIWSALSGNQAEHAVGGGGARRYHVKISVLAGIADPSAAALAALGELLPDEGPLMIAQTWRMDCPPGGKITNEMTASQLVYAGDGATKDHDHAIVPLAQADWPEMLALAQATQPGPFLMETPVLGNFFGVRRDGKLIAMAGERMRPGEYVEISAICTDPVARGEGLGTALCCHVRDQIIARGKQPFLHAYTTNDTALRLYENLGFAKRTELQVSVVEKA